MSVALRILLLIGALAMLMFVVKSIRKSRIQMKDALVWMLIALLIAIFTVMYFFIGAPRLYARG